MAGILNNTIKFIRLKILGFDLAHTPSRRFLTNRAIFQYMCERLANAPVRKVVFESMTSLSRVELTMDELGFFILRANINIDYFGKRGVEIPEGWSIKDRDKGVIMFSQQEIRQAVMFLEEIFTRVYNNPGKSGIWAREVR